MKQRLSKKLYVVQFLDPPNIPIVYLVKYVVERQASQHVPQLVILVAMDTLKLAQTMFVFPTAMATLMLWVTVWALEFQVLSSLL